MPATRGLTYARLFAKNTFQLRNLFLPSYSGSFTKNERFGLFYFAKCFSSIPLKSEYGDDATKAEEPLYNRRKHFSNKNKIFIGSKSFNHDKDFLSSLMSQFGTVKAVEIPRLNQYTTDEQAPNEYRFGFVTFQDEESYLRAIRAGCVQKDNSYIDIKDVEERNKAANNLSALNTIAIHDLPNSIHIKDLLDHFKSFGDVAFIDLIYNGTIRKTMHKVNFAFVTFKVGGSVIQKVIDSDHNLNSVQYVVSRVDSRTKLKTQKCLSIFVQGIPEEACNEDILYKHFLKDAKVKKIALSRDIDTNAFTGNAFVDFFTQEDAHKAELKIHEIAGVTLNVRALGWLSE